MLPSAKGGNFGQGLAISSQTSSLKPRLFNHKITAL